MPKHSAHPFQSVACTVRAILSAPACQSVRHPTPSHTGAESIQVASKRAGSSSGRTLFRWSRLRSALALLGAVLILVGQASPHSFAMGLMTNPVISGHPFSYTGWGDPWVMKTGSSYVMYLARNVAIPGRQDAVLPFRASSSDGVRWTIDNRPLLQPGASTADFDYLKVETPTVVVFAGKYHMYYAGLAGNDEDIAIGHATSSDGLTWVKDTTRRPVISRLNVPTSTYVGLVAEPSAIVLNNRLYLYFVAVELRLTPGQPPAKISLWRATALDTSGTRFDTPVKALEQSALYPASAGYEGYSTPAVVLYNGQVHLFYGVYKYFPGEPNEHVHVAIHHAVSADGRSGWQEDSRPLLRRGDLTWASQEVYAPTAVVDGTTLRLWFSGNSLDWRNGGRGVMGIGLINDVLGAGGTP